MSPPPNSHHLSHDFFCLTMTPIQSRASSTFISSPSRSDLLHRWYYIFLCDIHIITSHLLQIALLKSWHSSFQLLPDKSYPSSITLNSASSAPVPFLRNGPSLKALTTCHKFPIKHSTGLSNTDSYLALVPIFESPTSSSSFM